MTQATILHGDAIDMLRTLPDESVQMVCTSPPYFGLRDYGTAEWDDGDAECDHARFAVPLTAESPGVRKSTLNCGTKYALKTTATAYTSRATYRDTCGKCGATRIDRQIGLESTPAEYVAKMVDVFREVRRVLRKDGVCWLNIGDSYGAVGGDTHTGFNERWNGTGGAGSKQDAMLDGVLGRQIETGLRPKNLLMMPARVALALQADGWYLRQDIIWAKPNPMPESVTDRCTKAHEYVFLLSKSDRYFYDADAISEASGTDERPRQRPNGGCGVGQTRNKRSVWTITTEPYPDAHFATFPTELPRICILAGSRVGDTILDPFAGSGTTLQVALQLSRAAIGIELNAEYVALANKRLNRTTLGLPLEIAA